MAHTDDKHRILNSFLNTRTLSTALASSLQPEDQMIQSMPDASPTKWHLAHTSWFFETFILQPNRTGYQCFHPEYSYLFNSYYNQVGAQYSRPQRGLISRPTVAEVYRYREHVDQATTDYIEHDDPTPEVLALIELGIQHEQQHQELILTDIKHGFSFNPLYPALNHYQPQPTTVDPQRWLEFEGGVVNIGHHGIGFHYDNEGPHHQQLITPFKLSQRLVNVGEYLEFIADGGYDNPLLWLSDGWAWRQREQIQQPLYWQQRDNEWWQYSLSGLRPLLAQEPLCHISYYEADAFAQWCGKRLPTEYEWETAAQQQADKHESVSRGLDLHQLHPQPGTGSDGQQLQQLYGDCWQWTQSAYSAYPGFKAAAGAVGEYNGKFMCNQLVLKGSSCATPKGHSRPSYRNFFPPQARWQFSGIRIAADA
jgi:ergothioneine biosynthesis protein EgtB